MKSAQKTSHDRSEGATRGASFLELATVFTALAVMICVQLAASRMTFLLYHPLWLDECLTQLLATDPSFTHALAAIRGGVETNPPTLYFFLWPLAKLLGGDVVMLRGFAGASMVLALVGIYAICRRFFNRIPSTIGMLVVASHPIVVAMTLEARFYGPWLALATWFAYAMLIETTASNRVRLTIFRCVLAVLLATVHWFGVISLCLIGVTALWLRAPTPSPGNRGEGGGEGPVTNESRVRAGPSPSLSSSTGRGAGLLILALPLICGILATLACLPFYLGQRSGLSVATWMEPVTLRKIIGVGKHVVWAPAMLAFVVYAACRWVNKSTERNTASLDLLRRLAPLLALLLFPAIIAMFSLLVQPALQDRYVIVAVAPLGPIVAALAASGCSRRAIDRWVHGAVIVGLIAIGAYEFHGLQYFEKIADARFANSLLLVRETMDQRDKPLPIVFWQRREQYPVIHIDPALASETAVLDFEGVPRNVLSDRTIYERDMNRRVSHFYPQYELITIDQLRAMRRFIFVIAAYELEEAVAILPDFKFTPLGPEQFDVRLKE